MFGTRCVKFLPGRETTQQVALNGIIREVDTALVRSKEWERLA